MTSITPALPVQYIGPDGGINVATASPSEFKRVPGDRPKPRPMVPPEAPMTKEGEDALAAYLSAEIDACSAERWSWISKLARLKHKYNAPFPETPKDWPIANSSQLTVPIIKTAVNTVVSRLYQTAMAADPLVAVRTEESDALIHDSAFDYERFLNQYATQRVDIEKVLDTFITELVKLGTGILEVTTKRETRGIMVFDPDTNTYQKRVRDLFDGPTIYNVPLEDFWIRPAYTEIQSAPWCGKALRLTWAQIKDMAISGELDAERIDRIWNHRLWFGADQVPKTQTQQEKDEVLEPNDRDTYRLFELSVRWDTDGEGDDEELLVYYHHESHTLLRRKFSQFPEGSRPWRRAVFVAIEHWFYGEGLAAMLEHLQEEISTIHNQRIDNATIANLRIILVRRMIQGLRPGDPLWSGKVVKVGNIETDVGTLQIGDIYRSTVDNEMISQSYVERLTGIGASAAGTAQPVTRTTATAQMALLEELNRRFDKAIKSIRVALRDAFLGMHDLFMMTGTGGLARLWLGEVSGGRVESLLREPRDVAARKYKLVIVATRSTVNREVEFQTQIAVWQLILQMWQQIRAEAGQLAPQLIPVLAHEMVKAIKPVFKKIMQYADAPNPDEAVSVLAVLERILPPPEDLGGMEQAQEAENTAALQRQLVGRDGGAGGGIDGNGRQGATSAGELAGLEDTIRTLRGAGRGQRTVAR